MLDSLVFFQKSYFSLIKGFALQKYAEKIGGGGLQWVFLEFSPFGFIGKLFVASELNDFIMYLSIFFNDWPCDWLLMSYTRTRSCRVTQKIGECIKIARSYGIRHTLPLFQHVGYHSSLMGKISKEKLKHFPAPYAAKKQGDQI